MKASRTGLIKKIALATATVSLALACIGCAGKGGAVEDSRAKAALVGTWKHDRLVLMFDANGSCQEADLRTGQEESGKFMAEGPRLVIKFDSGLGLKCAFRFLGNGDLQLSDEVLGNAMEFAKEK
jgi:hypothetical protein